MRGTYEPIQNPAPGVYKAEAADVNVIEFSPLNSPNNFQYNASSYISSQTTHNHPSQSDEKPKIALARSFFRLLLSFFIHIIAVGATMAILMLTVLEIYWFDNDEGSSQLPIDFKVMSVSLNELLNGLQFVAKIHEILMVASLSAIVMHFVRRRMLGESGLPFGLVISGYNVGSAEYLFSKTFWTAGWDKTFWLFSFALVVATTLLAQTLGPASAIALIPNLDWWLMNQPFGGEEMPIYATLNRSDIWPQTLNRDSILRTRNDTIANEVCFTTDAEMHTACPGSEWQTVMAWAVANSNQGMPANVTIVDKNTDAKRVISSRLSSKNGYVKNHDSYTGQTAITTSLNQGIATSITTFWQYLQAGEYPINKVIRPKLSFKDTSDIYQPLVQTQCSSIPLPYLAEYRESRNVTIHTDGINTFSSSSASSWPMPDWVYDFKYPTMFRMRGEPDEIIIPSWESVNISWVDFSNKTDNSLSMGAIVIMPDRWIFNNDTIEQVGIVYACSIDARWIATEPTYDPQNDPFVRHNVTDPLLFAKPAGKDVQDKNKYGVSEAISISSSFADAFTFNATVENQTSSALQFIFSQYIQSILPNDTATAEPNGTVQFFFSPNVNLAKNESLLSDMDFYLKATSDSVATTLSLVFTEGIARTAADPLLRETMVRNKQFNSTYSEFTILSSFAGLNLLFNKYNATAEEQSQYLPTLWSVKVERYGYGYGFHSKTVIFGISVLLVHAAAAVLYICYATFEFAWTNHYTSSAWGDIGEFAALLINSNPTKQLQNTCAGIGQKSTWRKLVRIREVGDAHLGVVIGDGDELKSTSYVRKGFKYGTLDESVVRRRRRNSV